MLYESQVVEAVCMHLSHEGWTIQSSCGPTEKGDDIVATRQEREIRIEAKGEGSEQPHTNKFGEAFSRGQVKNHVAVALYRAAKMRNDSVMAGMAFPDNKDHRDMVADIQQSTSDLGIVVYWVAPGGVVTVGR